MNIGIDARFLNESGIGRYLRNLLKELQKIDQENNYFIFVLKKDFDQLELSKNFTKVTADFKWYGLEEQIKFPKLLSKYNLDLLHIPHFNVPIFYQGKFIVTIHDLVHQHVNMRRATTHNMLVYNFKRFAYKKVFSNAIKRSQKIITVSEFVKKQLVEEWNTNKEKIKITYESVDENLIDISKNITKQKSLELLEKFNVKQSFLFYVGNAHPHKNTEGLIKSFLELKKDNQNLQLVLSGKEDYFWKKIKSEYKDQNIIYTGKISDEELVAFYKTAKAFVTASKEEGFGLQLLEAMSLSCPIISSNKGSLPEIGGNAAIYFDPNNQPEMLEKISQLLNSEKLSKNLIEKGLKRYKQFNWEKLAKQTLEIYQKA